MNMKTVGLLLFFLLFTGCAQMPELTRAEWLALTTKTYEGITQDEALAAVEKIFRLADEDFRFQHTEDGLIAHRPWLVYLVIGGAVGTDIWTVKTTMNVSSIRVSAHVRTTTNTITAVPAASTTGSTTTVVPATLPGDAIPVQSTAIYDLFFARLDYLLGQRDTWMSCKKASERVSAGITYGHTEPLCQIFTTQQLAPEGAVVE